ncbi:MAG: thiosulfate sulfurtransferase GlpE [Prevotellaceae bacterium]|jgi:thiosulfate sulfurtransferase|nr:thiosulfate sulfurtransferase GlpE [Prevotellaceae bacterium]
MEFKRITSYQAKEKLSNPDTVLLDIRDAENFHNGHVKGAIHFTQEGLPAFLAETDRALPILVMCYHGNSSQVVAQFLTEQGFTDVYSVDGGYEEWK